MGIKWLGGGGWVVVEIFTTFFSHMKNQTKTNPVWVGTQTSPRPHSLSSRHTPYTIVITLGSRAVNVSVTMRYTYIHIFITWLDLGWGSCRVSLRLFFKHFGSRTIQNTFSQALSSEYWSPCVFREKSNTHVSDSFTLNSSNCCFVRVIWCPRSFIIFLNKPYYLKQDVPHANTSLTESERQSESDLGNLTGLR